MKIFLCIWLSVIFFISNVSISSARVSDEALGRALFKLSSDTPIYNPGAIILDYLEPYDASAKKATKNDVHAGLDFKAEPRNKHRVYSIIDGEVINKNSAQGLVAIYNSSKDITLIYLHLDTIEAKYGKITPTDPIGNAGEMISAGSPHLHIEVRKGRQKNAVGGASCGGRCNEKQIASLTIDPRELTLVQQEHLYSKKDYSLLMPKFLGEALKGNFERVHQYKGVIKSVDFGNRSGYMTIKQNTDERTFFVDFDYFGDGGANLKKGLSVIAYYIKWDSLDDPYQAIRIVEQAEGNSGNTGTQSKQPVILMIDGICLEATTSIIANNTCWTNYLKENLSPQLSQYLVTSFQWTGDSKETPEVLPFAEKTIRGYYEVARHRGQPFKIIAHSWGSVLSYIVLKKNPDIKVDTFITLGSPLRSQGKQIVEKYTSGYAGSNIEKPVNIGRWVNYWAWNDLISGPIYVASKNFQIDDKIAMTDYRTRLAATKDFHSKYYTEWKSSIVADLAVPSASDNRENIEKEIDNVGRLIEEGRYTEADIILTELNNKYPNLYMEHISGASERLAIEYRVILDQKLNKVDHHLAQNTFILEGIVTDKSNQEGSGAFWFFKVRSKEGIEYPFTCSSYNALQFKLDGKGIDLLTGYEYLKNKYKTVKLYISNKNKDYVLNKCKNNGCDGICPDAIEMLSFNMPPDSIPNFRKISDKLFAGGQPKNEKAIKLLADRGIKSIINLMAGEELEWKLLGLDMGKIFFRASTKEENWARKYRIKFEWDPLLPLLTGGVFSCPTKEAVELALNRINNLPYPVYVHCSRGRDRTGMVVAAYRVKVDGWSVEDAAKEWNEYMDNWSHHLFGKWIKCFRDYYSISSNTKLPSSNEIVIATFEGFPIAYYSDKQYHEIAFSEMISEKEASAQDLKYRSMLNKVKQLSVISGGQKVSDYKVDRVAFGNIMGCSNSFNFIFANNKAPSAFVPDQFLLSGTFRELNKFVKIKSVSPWITAALQNEAKKKLRSIKAMKPANINMSSLKVKYINAYDMNSDQQPDFFILAVEVKLFKSVKTEAIQDDILDLFMVITKDGSQYRVLYASEPLYNNARLIGAADIDGDGNIEIIITKGIYEAWQFEIWRFENGGFRKVYSGTGYGC